MPAWDDLKFALALSRHGRMNSAAQSLGINVATMSRRIERLGEILGQPPFVKKADGWEPSPMIHGLLQIAEDVEQRLETEMNSIRNGTAGQSTRLSIGCPPIVSLFVLYPNIAHRSPALSNVTYTFTQRVMEDGLGENDLVLQHKRPESGRVITQKVATLTSSVYRRRGAKENSGWVSLSDHFDPTPFNQAAYQFFPEPPSMRVQSMYELYEIVGATDMAGPLVDIVAASNPDLEVVPGGEELSSTDMWMIYHASRKGDPVMDGTITWVKESFAKMQTARSEVVNLRRA
ncbi:LysR family transcriptional regulator [Vannielia litorea]|uniref:LysR family transcriptional regulator n=1 Tax=Vannielia TaxID=2813041 RepID=UPI001C988649|nr:LysR family transcriptional regulator [Vannielia litorea]MBY6047363.1 LysR family transcriptional regulator [Vannielia litorea]MBY6074777.1 LysR family transcriptional regulator [Vannielia litorea]